MFPLLSIMRLTSSAWSKHQTPVAAPARSAGVSTETGSGLSSLQGQYASALNSMNKTVEVMVDVKYSTSPLDLYNLMFDSCVHFPLFCELISTESPTLTSPLIFFRDFLVKFLTESQKVWGTCRLYLQAADVTNPFRLCWPVLRLC